MASDGYDRGDGNESRTFRCPDCGRQCTRGLTGVEYGHERGVSETGTRPRCPRRPRSVDPKRFGPAHDGWAGAGGESA